MRLTRNHAFVAAALSLLLLYLAFSSSPPRPGPSRVPPHSPQRMGAMSSRESNAPAQADNGQGEGALFTADAFQKLVGLRALDTAKGDEIPADRAGEGEEWVDVQKLRAERGAGRTRILGHGAMATMDYVPARLNVHLDQDGKVSRVAMG